jgi:hypothetical protein
LELLYPTWGETKSYKYIREGYPSFLLGPNLNLSGYVVNIEEESEVYRTPAPKTVHILYRFGPRRKLGYPSLIYL